MGIEYSPTIVIDNLHTYYDFANSLCYTGTGSSVNDLIRSSTLSLINGPIHFAENPGYIILDGANDYLTLDIPSFQSYTISFWIYILNYDNSEKQIFSVADGSVGISLLNGKFNLFDGVDRTGSTDFNTLTWYNLTITRAGLSTKIYVNAVLDGSFFTGVDLSPGSALIGQQNNQKYLSARISNFLIYSTSLTEENVLKNFKSMKSRYGY
jgi:hypothetical protein